MRIERLELSDELRGIIEDLQHNPKAKLLRRDAALERVTSAGRSVLRRATEPGLVAAERELLRVHRSSLALALRQASWNALAASGAPRNYHVDFEVWARDRVAAALASLLEGALGSPSGLLERRPTPETARSLATLSLSIEDHVSPITCTVAALAAERRWSVARRLLQQSLRRPWPDGDSHYLWSNLGFSASEEDDNRTAARCYLAAASMKTEHAASWARALLHAVLSEDEESARRASRVLSDLPEEWCSSMRVAHQEIDQWSDASPDHLPARRHFARSMEPSLGDRSRSYLNAFFC